MTKKRKSAFFRAENSDSRAKSNKSAKRAPKTRALRIESLEDRALLSAASLEPTLDAEIVAAPLPTSAALSTILVTSTADSPLVDGSLRRALAIAKNGDLITFSPSLKGKTITLQGEELKINKEVVLDATALWDAENDAPGIAISSAGLSRVMTVTENASLIGLEIRDGGNVDKGAGIYVPIFARATVSLEKCLVADNVAVLSGGGIYSEGNVVSLTDCHLTGNRVVKNSNDDAMGEGLFPTGGGALYTIGGTTRLDSCDFVANSSDYNGGAYCSYEGRQYIVDCSFSQNSTLGNGAGSYAKYGQSEYLRTTFEGGDAKFGGGGCYRDFGNSTFDNCVFGANSAAEGGGIDAKSGTVSLTSCTVSGNVGGGVVSTGGGALVNSIVAMNVNLNATAANVVGPFLVDHCLLDVDPRFVVPPTFSAEPKLLNETTLDLGLTSESPAVDAGVELEGASLVDALGNPRVVKCWASAPTIDIGAIEFQMEDDSYSEPRSTIVTTALDLVDKTDGLTSLREAISRALPGETITFAPELDGATIALDGAQLLIDKAITVDAGESGISIDARTESRAIYVSESATIKGLVFVNGKAANDRGGAIYVADGAPRFERCVVKDSRATQGGGIYVGGGDPTFVEVAIVKNVASVGGGVCVAAGSSTFVGCTASDNVATSEGGGFRIAGGTATFKNTVAAGNRAQSAPDASIVSGSATAFNSLSSVAFWSNSDGNNIVQSAAISLFVDPENGDYRPASGSALVDRGNDAFVETELDARGASRIVGTRVDIGAFERANLPSPTLSVSATATSLVARIGSVSGAERYVLEYSTSEDFAESSIKTWSSSGVKTISGARPNTTYYVRVKAIAPRRDDSEPSSATATTPKLKLATPTLAVSSVSINSISIQIGASTGASAYVVDVSESSTFASPVSYRFDSAGTKTLSGLPDDSTLFVRVKAVAPDYDDSDFVSISAATLPKPVLTLSSPTVSASTTKTAIALRVGEVANATNYRVEVSANESFANPIVKNYSSAGLKTITNLESNTTYWVRVVASAVGYETSEPAALVATTDRETLAAPTLDVLSVDARSILLSVGAVPSASRYVLERSSSPNFSGAISVVLDAPGEVPFDNVAPETELYFRVKATANGFKDSQWTSATAATTPDPLVVTTLIDSEETIGSLRRAIAEAKDGEVVSFDPSLRGGTIVLNGSQLVLDKAISIDATALWNESENAPGLSIDANGASRALYISDDASIAGLEIVGGATDEVGGAIYSRYANPVVTRCLIRDSSATNGGAIHVQYGAPSFVSCVVENNYASVDGGGVYVQGGEATFLDCQIRFNESAKYGGGIENRLGDVVFVNCAIYGNRTTNHGGGIYNREGTADFYNCTVTANQGHGIYVSYGTSRLYNTITAQNSDSGIDAASLEAVNSLIDVPPAFVVPPQFEGDRLLNPNELDLRLSQNSLAIDRGDSQYVSTDVDLSGAPRVRANWKESPTVDIGAYEYQETFEKTLETPSTVVTTNLDVVDDSDGLTSLREAILWANQGDVVTFDPSLKGSTIELQGSQLHVPKELTIDATPLWDAQTDAPGITIDAGRRSRAIYAIGDVSLKGLIVTGGESTKTGGGIYLDRATGTVERCRVVNNYDTFGAGICSSGGSPTIVDCEISGNEASYYGAGIYVGYGNASIVRCSIHDNKASLQGGGFFEREGETSLVDCVIFDNESKDGGGVYSQYGGWTMTNCAVYGNVASNNGGGVCSISGSVAIINSTIAGNSASNEGGGLFVHRISTSFSRIANSIIALNEASSSPDVRNRGTTGTGRLTANNVLSTFERWSNASDPDANNLLYDPDLSLFRDPSARDYRLVEDSQAVDKGNNSLIDLPTDLDGSERVVNSIVDLGAYEFKVVPLDVPTIAALSGTKTAIVVKLDAVEGAQKYVVEYATNSDFSNAASKTYSSPGSKTISGLPTGTWYYVRVKATATGRPDSPYTEVRTIYTGAAYAMPSFTFSTTKTAIVLNIKPGRIDASQGAPEKIVVEYSESPDFSNAKRRIINLPTDEGGIVKPCKPTISGLIFATQYYFRIKAIGSRGNDSAWNANSGKPIAAGQLAVPKFFTSKVGTEFFNVRCYNSAGASGFEVMWSTSSDFSEVQCAQGSASAGTVSITGLDPSAKYYYKVRALGDGVSRVDSPWSVIVGSATTKSAPASSALLDSDSDFENYFEEDELDEFWDVLAKSVAK